MYHYTFLSEKHLTINQWLVYIYVYTHNDFALNNKTKRIKETQRNGNKNYETKKIAEQKGYT